MIPLRCPMRWKFTGWQVNLKKLIIQQNGDHRMRNVKHQRKFLRGAADWFKSALLGQLAIEP